MSAWRIAVKALHRRGGAALAEDLYEFVESDPQVALIAARRQGMVTPGPRTMGHYGRIPQPWTLTDLGRRVARGEVIVQRPHRRYQFVPQQEVSCL